MANFKTIYPRLCSCGRELGILQYDFENSGKNRTEYLDELKITKMCCRKSIICAPNCLITNANENVFVDEVNVASKFGNIPLNTPLPITQNGVEPSHDEFPNLPGIVKPVEHVLLQGLMSPPPNTELLNLPQNK
jgi:DNA-directed RNA polymerase subunit N (RpoN/RPB10)